uniref:Uncharacterized protein n=1 Tax=Arion vulgaris TaxID=1028688 RepID=A0A0B7BQQ4_9EUPU
MCHHQESTSMHAGSYLLAKSLDIRTPKHDSTKIITSKSNSLRYTNSLVETIT